MPRQVRIEYPGAIYHGMARGNRREAIVLDDEDRDRSRKLLGDLIQLTAKDPDDSWGPQWKQARAMLKKWAKEY